MSPTPPRRPLLVFVVDSDPRTSHRPAEAVRVAAGVGTWKKADVRLVLEGPAVRVLGEWVDDLKDEDNFTRYLPIIRDWGHPVYVGAGNPDLADLGEATAAYEELDAPGLARLCASATSVLRF